MSDDGSYSLSWDLHQENSASTLKSLWETRDFLDVTIACDDDQIDAHKVILSAASPFFHNILKRNPHSHPLIYLRGTAKKDVQSLLNYIYSGETQVLQEDLEDFMALASSLKVKGLTEEESGAKDEIYSAEESGKKEEKFAESTRKKTKKQPTMKKRKKDSLSDDIEILETTEEICKIEVQESDMSDLVEKYASDENSESFQYQNISNSFNTSMTEYDERISELMTKTENLWNCTQCGYSKKNKNHVQEHVQSHIEGFSHECKLCNKTFSRKRDLRNHAYKCPAKVSS